MTDEIIKNSLILELNKELDRLLQTDQLSEDAKAAVLKQLLALTVNEKDGGSK